MSVVAGTARAANAVIDSIRRHVGVRDEILRAAKDRRNLIRDLASNTQPLAPASTPGPSLTRPRTPR